MILGITLFGMEIYHNKKFLQILHFPEFLQVVWDVLVSNSTDFGYYETLQKSPYTIDWGENLPGSVVHK